MDFSEENAGKGEKPEERKRNTNTSTALRKTALQIGFGFFTCYIVSLFLINKSLVFRVLEPLL